MGITRRVWLAGIVTPLLLLAGCFWPATGAGPDRRAHNELEDKITPSTVADLDVVWEAEIGGAVGDPVTSNKAVHASVGGALFGVDIRTGEELWVYEDPDFGDIVTMGPAVFVPDTVWSTDKDVLWTGYGLGNLGGNWVTRLLDAATGEPVAVPDGGGLVDGVRGDRYLLREFSFGSGTPVALGIQVGGPDIHQLWTAIIDIQQGGAGWAPLTLGEDHVFQAGQGLFSVEDGTPTRGNGVRGYEIGAAPDCPPPGEVLTCPTWATPLEGSTATSPVLTSDGTTLFTVTNTGVVYAVDASTGDILWSTPVGSGVTNAEPALAEGSLFVATADGQLVVLDAADGSLLWEAQAGASLRVQPAVAGGLVFTGATDGSMQAFDADGCGAPTCDPLWSATAGSSITGAPAVSNGRLYVGTADGRLVAYGLP